MDLMFQWERQARNKEANDSKISSKTHMAMAKMGEYD